MAGNIELNLEAVNSVISEVKRTITNNQSAINEEYNVAINQFAESSGETADGLRDLQKAEQELSDDMWAVLTKLSEAINFAATEFAKLDTDMTNIVDSGHINNNSTSGDK